MLEPYILTIEDTIVQVRDYIVFARDDNDAKERVLRGEFVTVSSGIKSVMHLQITDSDEVRSEVIVKKREGNEKSR